MATVFSIGRMIAMVLALGLGLAGCGGDNPEALLASARDYLAKNDPKAAVIQLKNALQKNPEMSEVRLLLGQALLRTGDAVGAETEFRKALALKHSAELVVPSLAQALLEQRQFKKLADEFASTELTQPAAQADLKTSIAKAQRALGKTELARNALQTALAADPEYGPALLIQARQIAEERDFDRALGLVEALLVKNPGFADAWKLKGDILLPDRKKADIVMASYRKAVELRPAYLEAHAAILTALLQNGSLDEATKQVALVKQVAPNSLTAAFFETMLAYARKDLKRAREAAVQMIKLAPNSSATLQIAGVIELELNSLIQAETFFGKSLAVDPEAANTRRLLAMVHLRSGQPEKALATIQPFLKNDKLDATSNAVIGEVFLQLGDPRRAEEYFTRASKLEPKNEKIRTNRALTLIASGRDQVGLAELQDVAVTETGTIATMALISAHLQRKEYDKALKAIDVLEKKQPGKPLASNLRGRTLLDKKDLVGARKSFEQSLANDPMFFASIASLASMDMAEKKPDDARKRFEAVLEKDPKNVQALLSIAELKTRAGGTKEDVAALITKAVNANPAEVAPRATLVEHHLRYKDFKLAVAAAQDGVGRLPESAELLELLGRAQQGDGDTNQAIATFNKLALLQPGSHTPFMRLADVQLIAKDNTAAAQSLQKAIAIKPDLIEAYRVLINIAITARNYDEAIRVARSVQKRSPKDPIGYQFEGDIAAQRKKWDAAVEVYREGLKQTSGVGLALRLHNALVSSGKAADADKLVASWSKDNPKDTAFRMALGDAATSRLDFAAAEKNYLAIVQIEPGNPVALNNLAWATGKLGKDGAVAYAEKAMALVPNQPAFMDTLAGIYSDKNDYNKALEWQTKVLAIAPQNSLFRLNLAKIHLKGGKKDLARKELEELAKLGTKFGAHAEVATLLQGL